MPELGDALGKAMERSPMSPEALVRQAAEGEPQTQEAAAVPAEKPREGAVSITEKTLLLAPGGAQAVPAKAPEAPETPEAAAEAAPAASQHKTKVLLPPAEAAASPSASKAGAAPSGEGEPIAPFAASGVIRRSIKRSATEPLAPQSPAAVQELGQRLAGCRKVKAFKGAADLKSPALVKALDQLVQMVLDGGAGRPALVTVCGAGERAGTTTVAAALALQLVERGHLRVLLADADARAPALARLAATVPGPDFAAVLDGSAPLEKAAIWSETDKLALTPLGPKVSPQFGKSLAGPELGKFLDGTRGWFDAVVFDAGNLTESDGAAQLAGASGAAVLVVRAGRTGVAELAAARGTLARAGTRLAGAVLTFAGQEK